MAAYTELYMDQGSTFNKVINLSDDVTNANLNISSYTVSSQLRRSLYAANATANLTCTITDASNGEITISMTAANTALIPHGRYLFDVVTIDQNSNKSRVLEGLIIVTAGITK